LLVCLFMGLAVDDNIENKAYAVKYAKEGLEADVELIKAVIESFKEEAYGVNLPCPIDQTNVCSAVQDRCW